MSKIGLIAEASVPRGMMVEITIEEDIDGDGNFENSESQRLKDGEYVYELDGFDGSLENDFSHKLSMGRDPEGPSLSPTRDNPQPPSLSNFSVIIAGPAKSNELDPKAAVHKVSECDYFLYRIKNCNPEEYRYNLNGFLSAAYSVDEIIDTDWSEWADSDAEADLHDLIIENRNQSTHLRKPARGSLRPPLSPSFEYDFGTSEGESTVRHGYSFVGVPATVIREFVPDQDRLEIGNEGLSMEDSPYARIVPATEICEVYYRLLQERVRDWVDNLDNSDFRYDLESLK